MRLIYSHASCTIAATAATDGDGGLFFDRNSENLRPLRLHATRNPENSASKDKKPPLDQYWCHQAEVCLPKCELHHTLELLYYLSRRSCTV